MCTLSARKAWQDVHSQTGTFPGWTRFRWLQKKGKPRTRTYSNHLLAQRRRAQRSNKRFTNAFISAVRCSAEGGDRCKAFVKGRPKKLHHFWEKNIPTKQNKNTWPCFLAFDLAGIKGRRSWCPFGGERQRCWTLDWSCDLFPCHSTLSWCWDSWGCAVGCTLVTSSPPGAKCGGQRATGQRGNVINGKIINWKMPKTSFQQRRWMVCVKVQNSINFNW